MKKTAFLTAILAFALILIVSADEKTEADAVLGKWLTGKKDSKVEIYKKNGKYHGKIVWLREPEENGKPKVDKNNPDEDKRNRPLLGMVLIKNFNYDEDYVWEDGEIYDPRNGKTYSCKMTLSEDGQTLEVRGYVGISLFGRTVEWTRTD